MPSFAAALTPIRKTAFLLTTVIPIWNLPKNWAWPRSESSIMKIRPRIRLISMPLTKASTVFWTNICGRFRSTAIPRLRLPVLRPAPVKPATEVAFHLIIGLIVELALLLHEFALEVAYQRFDFSNIHFGQRIGRFVNFWRRIYPIRFNIAGNFLHGTAQRRNKIFKRGSVYLMMRLFMTDNDIVFTGTGLQLIGNKNGRILIADKTFKLVGTTQMSVSLTTRLMVFSETSQLTPTTARPEAKSPCSTMPYCWPSRVSPCWLYPKSYFSFP